MLEVNIKSALWSFFIYRHYSRSVIENIGLFASHIDNRTMQLESTVTPTGRTVFFMRKKGKNLTVSLNATSMS